jgi:hypothetical protein
MEDGEHLHGHTYRNWVHVALQQKQVDCHPGSGWQIIGNGLNAENRSFNSAGHPAVLSASSNKQCLSHWHIPPQSCR